MTAVTCSLCELEVDVDAGESFLAYDARRLVPRRRLRRLLSVAALDELATLCEACEAQHGPTLRAAFAEALDKARQHRRHLTLGR